MEHTISAFQVALNDLADTRCYCGRDKQPGHVVCVWCFNAVLPDEVKREYFRAREIYVKAAEKAKRIAAHGRKPVRDLSA